MNDKHTQAEQDFIEQYARVYLVDWCCQTLTYGSIESPTEAGPTESQKQMATICLTLAEEKGWVGKSKPKKVLAKGYATAAAFLKR